MNVNDYETQTTETGEREAIWQIIQSSAEECGLSDPPEDVTEEWREWQEPEKTDIFIQKRGTARRRFLLLIFV